MIDTERLTVLTEITIDMGGEVGFEDTLFIHCTLLGPATLEVPDLGCGPHVLVQDSVIWLPDPYEDRPWIVRAARCEFYACRFEDITIRA